MPNFCLISLLHQIYKVEELYFVLNVCFDLFQSLKSYMLQWDRQLKTLLYRLVRCRVAGHQMTQIQIHDGHIWIIAVSLLVILINVIALLVVIESSSVFESSLAGANSTSVRSRRRVLIHMLNEVLLLSKPSATNLAAKVFLSHVDSRNMAIE